jgi:hypothetical protein
MKNSKKKLHSNKSTKKKQIQGQYRNIAKTVPFLESKTFFT